MSITYDGKLVISRNIEPCCLSMNRLVISRNVIMIMLESGVKGMALNIGDRDSYRMCCCPFCGAKIERK